MLQVKNRAKSALAADITDTDISLTVTTGEGAKFPQPGDGFHITIEDEILKCTARSTDTLTVTRAQEGTTAAAHSAGAAVELRVTAGIITEIQGKSAIIVRKTADEIVNDSDVLQDDDHLKFAVGANEVWEITFIPISYSVTDNICPNYGMSIPTNAKFYGFVTGFDNAQTWRGLSIDGGDTWEINGSGANKVHGFMKGILIVSSTAGDFQLRWAQNTANANNTTLRANSCLIAHKLA